MHSINMEKYGLYTDLISEQITKKIDEKLLIKEYDKGKIHVEQMKLLEDMKEYSKKKGNYTTITFEDITDKENRKNVLEVFQKELKELLKVSSIQKQDSCLIIGLGNKHSTPDALGPMIIDSILTTRHILLMKEPLEEGYRVTSKYTPGVAGVSGIETKDIIKGIIEKTKPRFASCGYCYCCFTNC